MMSNTTSAGSDVTRPAPAAAAAGPAAPRLLLLSSAGLVTAVFGLAVYANLAPLIGDAESYKYFPPFKPFVNANANIWLGAEYFNIASAIRAGDGFANPFPARTGPTAWMPPVYPTLLAGLLWLSGDSRHAVMIVVVLLQVLTLAATGLLVVALVRQTCHRISAGLAAALFVGATLFHFHYCYQSTHDPWLVLLALDLLVAGFAWLQPLASRRRAAVWGLLGGFSALVNPIVAFAWGGLTLFLVARQRAWSRLVMAALCAGLTLLPWVVRNYLVFGRLIPVKANLAYELYQSQCLTSDGLIQRGTFKSHPYGGVEQAAYEASGESAFLDRKSEQFWQAVRDDPGDAAARAITRCLAATIWYVPYDRAEERRAPLLFWFCRLVYALPFLGLLFLIGSSSWAPLSALQQMAIGIYLLYLLPYAAVSYYDRYAVPLIGVKVLLVVWGIERLLALGQRPEAGDNGGATSFPNHQTIARSGARMK